MNGFNSEMEIYYSVVNLIDWFVTKGQQDDKATVMSILDQIEEIADIHPSEVGDANDCGVCDTWEEVIDGFQDLIKNGERVPV